MPMNGIGTRDGQSCPINSYVVDLCKKSEKHRKLNFKTTDFAVWCECLC